MTTLFYDVRRLLVLLFLLILVGGLGALGSMANEEDPRITNRVATVLTSFPGASAARVEQLVTERIEARLKQLDEVDELRSVSTNGLSSIIVVLKDSITEPDTPFGLVRDALTDVTPDLPAGAGVPIFDDTRAGAYTVLVALTWEAESDLNLVVLRRSALELKDRMRAFPGTELVTLHGASKEEISVALDRSASAALGLSKTQIAQAIESADAKVSAGQFKGEQTELNLEVRGEIDGLSRLRETIIGQSTQGLAIRLGDVATLSRGIASPATDLAYHNGKPAIVVATRMQAGLRVADWTSDVRQLVQEFELAVSDGVKVEIIFDQGGYASERFQTLVGNLLIGAGLVVLVLFVTLGWRSALIVSAAIPLTGLASLIILNLLGRPINQISITGLIVALGLLVDAAIVMTDSVRRHLLDGTSPRESVRLSVQRLWLPLFSSTLTTVLAFLPLVILPGGAGEFVGGIGSSVIVALIASFALAMTAIAALAGIFLKPPSQEKGGQGRLGFLQSGIQATALGQHFEALFLKSLAMPKRSIAIACLLPLIGFYGVTTLPTSFFPEADRNQFYVELRLPSQSAIDETTKAVRKAQQYLETNEEIVQISWFVGRSAPSFYYNIANNQDGNASYAQAMITTRSVGQVKPTINEVGLALQARLPDVQVISRQLSQGPPTFSPIELRIFGNDMKILQDLGEKSRLIFAEIDEVTATNPSFAGGEPKLWLDLDPDRARQFGLGIGQASELIRAELDGVVSGSIVEGTEELDIRIWTAEEDRNQLSDLASIEFVREDQPGNSVPVLALGELELLPAPATLRRFQGNRVNIISGYVAAGEIPSTAIEKFKLAWEEAGHEMPPGYNFQFGGDEEARADNFGVLLSIFGIISIIMLATVVLTFNSFRLAAIVFIVAILSTGLGMLSLTIFQFPFGFQPIVALIGLIGVAINAAIIILSGLKSNTRAKQGDRKAITDEVMATSRHIWSTTITTFGGFLPLILSEGGFWPPFATAIAGGVLLSTIVSFFLVPQMFLLLSGFEKKSRSGFPKSAMLKS
ncbi:efflux RND transporter permease subunit [Parasphingorhabdus sp.]|uniref:efflux RND transporter permease subunit n=1 Tax=Parasphingorhabdus sp. TaxID=2709688 RepID=UPI003BAEA200